MQSLPFNADLRPAAFTPRAAAPRRKQFAAPAVAKRARVSPICWIFLGCVALLNAVDTYWSDSFAGANPLRAAVPVTLSAVLFAEIFRRRRIEGGRVMEWVAAFVCAGAISSAFCAVPILGFIKLGLYIAVLVPLCLSNWLHRAFDGRSRGMEILAGSALLLVLVNVALFPITQSGIYDNANKAGMFAVCAWPLMAVFIRDPRRWARYAARLGVAACIALCLVTWCRAALASVLAGLVMYASLRKEATMRSVLTGLMVSAILGGASYFLAKESVQEYAFKGRTQLMDGTRQFMFRETVERVWEDSPILGYGFGLSWTLRPSDVDAVLTSGRMSWFTVEFGNSTIAILSGGGFVLLAAFIGLLGCAGRIVFRGLRSPALPPAQRDMLLALCAGIASLLVHAQAEAWLMAPLNWSTVIFWFYVGLAVYLARQARMLEYWNAATVHAGRPRRAVPTTGSR
jgi:hypothetical protein